MFLVRAKFLWKDKSCLYNSLVDIINFLTSLDLGLGLHPKDDAFFFQIRKKKCVWNCAWSLLQNTTHDKGEKYPVFTLCPTRKTKSGHEQFK